MLPSSVTAGIKRSFPPDSRIKSDMYHPPFQMLMAFPDRETGITNRPARPLDNAPGTMS
jgi:hypothetical protein